LIARSSAAAEKSGEGMAYKIRLERKHFLMLWIFDLKRNLINWTKSIRFLVKNRRALLIE